MTGLNIRIKEFASGFVVTMYNDDGSLSTYIFDDDFEMFAWLVERTSIVTHLLCALQKIASCESSHADDVVGIARGALKGIGEYPRCG